MAQLTNEIARFKISCPECAEKTEHPQSVASKKSKNRFADDIRYS